MQLEKTTSTKSILTVVALVAILAIATYMIMNTPRKTTQVMTTKNPGATVDVNVLIPPTTSATSVDRDGTYTALGDYVAPSGTEHIQVSITLKNGIIVNTSAVVQAKAGTSKDMQTLFVANYKTQVIGKNIADVKLTKVSGSSLTPKGFNDALLKIGAQASLVCEGDTGLVCDGI